MTLGELKESYKKANKKQNGLATIPWCNKLYLDLDRSMISAGLKRSYLDGMRMKASEDNRDYLELEDLVDGADIYYVDDGVSVGWDGNYEYGPAGYTVQLLIDVDDFEIVFSDSIRKDLELFEIIEKAA